MGASALASFGNFPRRAGQRGAGKHAVFARDPPLTHVAQKLRHGFFDRRGADDARVADFNQRRTLRRMDEFGSDLYGAKLVRGTIVRAKEHDWRLYDSPESRVASPESRERVGSRFK